MSLETGTYISDLVATNPTDSDPKSQGDNHLQLIKGTLKNTLPGLTGAVNATHTEMNYLVGVTSLIQTQLNNKLGLTGGALTSDLNITPVAAAARLLLNKPAGAYSNSILGRVGTSNRWQLDLGDATAEGGSNAGSNFILSRYNDAGTLIDTPITISRATGAMVVAGALSINTPTLPPHAVTKAYADTLFGSFATALRVNRTTRSSNTAALGVAELASVVEFTANTFTQTIDPAATVGAGWWMYLTNSGTGSITIDPSGSETIDGATTRVMAPGESRMIQCDGSNFKSVITTTDPVKQVTQIITSGTSWAAPSTLSGDGWVEFELMGGGGGGGRSNSTFTGGGGGFGGYVLVRRQVVAGSSYTIAIGAGGAGGTGAATAGSNGGSTTLVIAAETFTAGGGTGGGVGASQVTAGGTGGVATGGDFNLPGPWGMFGAASGLAPSPGVQGRFGSASMQPAGANIVVTGYGAGSPGTANATTTPGNQGAIVARYLQKV